MTVISPPALEWFFAELKRRAPADDAAKMILSGIAVAKGGYHDSRENNERRYGIGGNYSIELELDLQGAPFHAAAIDITFTDAQKSRFETIAKYFRRLLDAYRARDPRLFYKGERVWRECFGNADLDREVEGWSLYQGKAKTSDSSHLFHIHQSVHRKFANNREAVAGAVDIMLGVPMPKPEPVDPPEDPMPTAEDIAQAILDAPLSNDPKSVYHGVSVRNGLVGITGKLDLAKDRDKLDALRDATEAAAVGRIDTELDALASQADVEGVRSLLQQLVDRLPPSPPA